MGCRYSSILSFDAVGKTKSYELEMTAISQLFVSEMCCIENIGFGGVESRLPLYMEILDPAHF